MPRAYATSQYTGVQMTEEEIYFNIKENQLKQVEEKLEKKKVDLATVTNYTIKVF